ncbi:MAG: hypothetical protein Q7T55_19725, partial [Solirubrobacteraceae bacterium]|nr:hypothetical protein [Solirubrobacteraceae bacterium]
MSSRITPPTGPRRYNTALDEAMYGYESAVSRLDEADAVTVEVVRLRVARLHDCRRCQAVRFEAARDQGFDEDLSSGIDDYEHSGFPERLVVALRLVDTMLLTPASVDPALRGDLARHFTRAQVAHLLLAITKFSVNKALVALQIDAPLEDGTT